MAYKIPTRALQGSSSAAAVKQSAGASSPLAEALAQHIRSANLSQLNRLSQSAAREATSGRAKGKQAVSLLLMAAAAARALGDLSSAEMWLAQAESSLPPCSADLLAQLRREQVRLLLDKNELRAAITLVAQIDCTVIDRGLDLPLISRNDAELTPDTLLLQAEVALVAGATEDALKLLGDANRRMTENAGTLSRAETVAANDRRDYLRLLQAVYCCRIGSGAGEMERLSALAERLEFTDDGNKVLLARCQAVTGQWAEVDSMPPAGINLIEARRWQSMSRPATPQAVVVMDSIEQSSGATSALAVTEQPPPSPVFIQPHLLDAYAAHLRESVTSVASSMTAQFTEQLKLVVAQSNQSPGADGFVYGGKLPHIDIASVVVQAEMQRETGYICARWPAALVETTIQAGRLSPLARCGIGWIWMRDGDIIDATLCTEDAPPAEAADSASALAALTCLLQIGIGVCIDHTPEGEAMCYRDDRVRPRHARIQIAPGSSQNLMQSLVVACESKHGKSTGLDVLGAWEK